MGRLAGIAIAAVAVLTLAACGGDTTTVVNNTTTVTADPTTDEATTATETAATTATTGVTDDCGDVANGGTGIYNVEASSNLKCEYARNLAAHWLDTCVGQSDCAIGDYACESRPAGNETAEVTCRGAAEGVEARFVLASFDPS